MSHCYHSFSSISENECIMNDTTEASKTMDKDNSDNPTFNSWEFRKFLSNNPTELFSKDSSSLDDVDSSSLFQSKESFSNLFASKNWEMKRYHHDAPATKSYPTSLSVEDTPLASFSEVSRDKVDKTVATTFLAAYSINSDEEPDLISQDVMKSRDWMPQKTLGNHVDIPYSFGIFGTESSKGKELPSMNLNLPPEKTPLDELFMAQLMPRSPSPTLEGSVQHPELEWEVSDRKNNDASAAAIAGASGVTVAQFEAAKKKRTRAPRKKVVPASKEYVEPTNLDVLCGRGGRSNHHPGNTRYREEVENLKEWYTTIEDKDEKTDLSQCLVNYVKSNGARFLEHDQQGWYIVDNIVARRKASQALREDTDPDKRRAKRQRFLAKRDKLQEEARKKKKAKG